MFFTLVIVIGYLGLTMYLANQEQYTGRREIGVRMLLYAGVGLILLLGFYVLLLDVSSSISEQVAEQGEAAPPATSISTATLVMSLLLTSVSGALAFAMIGSETMRMNLEQLIGNRGTYRATSIVHTTAVVLLLLLITGQIVPFLVAGGTETMASNLQTQGVSLTEPVLQAFLQVLAAFLGVGYAIRRDITQALQRLSLRWPTALDVRMGIITGGALVGVLFAFNFVLVILQSPEEIEAQNQAAESLALAFATPLAAFILSASAAIGEEVFFRGALQPVFGNILTSIVFVLLHTQVFITPGILLLFIVSLGLGWIRIRHSTTTAVIAHFIYNFTQLLLLIFALEATAS